MPLPKGKERGCGASCYTPEALYFGDRYSPKTLCPKNVVPQLCSKNHRGRFSAGPHQQFTNILVCRFAMISHLCPSLTFGIYRGGGNFARGEFCGENFAVKKGGEIFPWRNFGVTVPSFTTAAGIVFPEQGQAQLRTRLCLLMP